MNNIKINIEFDDLLEIVKRNQLPDKYILLMSKYIKKCENCGIEYVSRRPELSMYCPICISNNIVTKKWQEENIEKVRETKRNWYKKKKEAGKCLQKP